MAILHLSPPSSTCLLHSTDLHSTALPSPKGLHRFSSNQNCHDASLHFPSYSSSRESPISDKWRVGISFFAPFLDKTGEIESLKQQLLDAIAPLDRGGTATPEDQRLVDQVCLIGSFYSLIVSLHL